jgi:glyoxylase-like metal-dependent hydrolase (beta-lactamase superfamily II)
MHPRYLSNAFVVGESRGGAAVIIDSGAPVTPLLQFATTQGLRLTHILRTHSHHDHIEHEDDLDLPVMTTSFETGGLKIEAIPTPGHSEDGVCFVIIDPAGDELVATGDVLFKDSIGGGDFAQVKKDVMDVLMTMPHDRRVLPGHSDMTSVGREWMLNPFVRVWRADEPEGTERVTAGGRDATLIAWGPDYDGKGKAWVRYDDGEDAIVAGSSVEREG